MWTTEISISLHEPPGLSISQGNGSEMIQFYVNIADELLNAGFRV